MQFNTSNVKLNKDRELSNNCRMLGTTKTKGWVKLTAEKDGESRN